MINSIKMDKTNSLEKKEITINSSVENLAYVEQEIEAIFDEFGISFDLFGNVLIAVTEAVTNAISYGNRNDVVTACRFYSWIPSVQFLQISISERERRTALLKF